MKYVALSDIELIEKLQQAQQKGEVTFRDHEGHTVHITMPQHTHVTLDFGEREIF